VNSRGKYFSEWAPPDFTKPQCLAVLAILAVTLLVMARLGARWFDILMVGLALGFLVYSARTVTVAACMLVPLAAYQLQRLLGSHDRPERRELAGVLAVAAAALAALAALVPTTSASSSGDQPAWIASSLSSLPPGTRVYDEMAFGGYLMWRFPDLDFMSNGYGDIYTTQQLDDLNTIGTTKPGWDRKLAHADPAYALVVPDSPLTYALITQEHWTVLHHSQNAELLKPPAGWAASVLARPAIRY
jgi:hypothetical protein